MLGTILNITHTVIFSLWWLLICGNVHYEWIKMKPELMLWWKNHQIAPESGQYLFQYPSLLNCCQYTHCCCKTLVAVCPCSLCVHWASISTLTLFTVHTPCVHSYIALQAYTSSDYGLHYTTGWHYTILGCYDACTTGLHYITLQTYITLHLRAILH